MRTSVLFTTFALAAVPARAGEPPAVKAQVEEKERADTQIYVRTAPPGAKIAVDGKPIGESPRLFPIPPGARTVTLTIELDGYETEGRTVEVQGGRVTRLSFDLRPAAGGPETGKEPAADRTRGAKETAEAFLRAIAEGRIDAAFDLIDPAIRSTMDEAARRKEAEALRKEFDLSRVEFDGFSVDSERARFVTGAIPARSGERDCFLWIRLVRGERRWMVVEIEELSRKELLDRRMVEKPVTRGPRETALEYVRGLGEGAGIATVLAAGDAALALSDEFPRKDGGKGIVAIRLARADGAWRADSATFLDAIQRRAEELREFRAKHPDAVEDPPPPAPAAPGKTAPAREPRGVRATAQAFVTALGESRIDDALALARPELAAERGDVVRTLERYNLSRVGIATALLSGDDGLAVTDEFPERKGDGRGSLAVRLERAGGAWRVRGAGMLTTAERREDDLREFRAKHPDAVEDAPRPAPAAPGKAAPAREPRGVRATAQAFVTALGENRVDDALALLEKGTFDGISEFAGRFDLSRARIETALAGAGRGLALTDECLTRDGKEPARLGLSLERRWSGWRIRDVDFLPSEEAREKFLAEFLKVEPGAAEEAPPPPAERDLRAVAARFARAIASGDAKAIEEFWTYEDPIDREAGEILLAVIAKELSRGGARPKVDVVHVEPIGEDRFSACLYVEGFPFVSGGSGPGPWFLSFEGVDGRWRTQPFPGLRTIVAAREGGPERIGRRSLAKSIAHLRFAPRGVEEMLAALRGQAASFEALAGPPYRLEQFKAAVGALREQVTRLEEMSGSWEEFARKVVESWKERPEPAAVAKDFYLLFYIAEPEGERGVSFPFPSENRTIALDEWPCLTEEEVAEASVGLDPSTRRPIVNLLLTRHGKELFEAITRKHIGKTLAIVVEGKVLSAPRILGIIAGGRTVISGNFSREEAERIANGLNGYREKVRAFLKELREKGLDGAGRPG